MSNSVPTVDQIIAGFQHTKLTEITGKPSYTMLAKLKRELITNVLAMHSNQGGGSHGYRAIIVSDTEYALLVPTPFVTPKHPGAQPIIPMTTPSPTPGVIVQIVRKNTEELHEYREHANIQQAVTKQLVTAIDPLYLKAIQHRDTGLSAITSCTILDHLFTTYKAITVTKLDDNDVKMKQQWDTTQPFETIIEQVEDACEYATAGKQPYSDSQILNTAHRIFFQDWVVFQGL